MNNKTRLGGLCLSLLGTLHLGCASRETSLLANESSQPVAEQAAALSTAPGGVPDWVLAKLPANASILSHETSRDADGSLKAKVTFSSEGQVQVRTLEAPGAFSVPLPKARPQQPLSERLQEALNELSPTDQLDIDIYVKDEVDHARLGGSNWGRFEYVQGKVIATELNGIPVGEEELRRLHDETQAEIAANEQARNDRRALRLRELAQRLHAGDQPPSKNWLRRKASGAEIRRIAAACGDLCASIELHTDIGTSNISLTAANTAMGTTNWAFPYGYKGTSVGVWLRDAGNPDPNLTYTNSAGSVVKLLNSAKITLLNSLPIETHTTMVTASIQSATPNAQVYVGDAGANTCYIRTNLTSLTNPPVYLASHAWGWTDGNSTTYGECARQWDNFVYQNRVTTFFSAGNYPDDGGTNVTTPGRGYNIIAVGAYNSANSTISGFSAYGNPDTGAEKPEIVAPGEGIDIGPYPGVSGTSIAAPLAAGAAADLISSNISTFGYHPEIVKAYMLAGATTNVEGAARLSDKDGAGAVNYRNTQFYNNGAWWNGANGDFFGTNNQITLSQSLVAGARYRMAIVWLVPGDYSLANKRPSMDIDLYVKWGTSVVASSTSVANTFELVDFVAANTGSYTLAIKRYSNSGVGNVLLGLSVTKIG